MKKYIIIEFILIIIIISFVLFVDNSFAGVSNNDIMNKVLERYSAASKSWAVVIQKHATYLFISLATISLVWTLAQLYFRRSSFTEFFGEVSKFTIFTGLYLWFLDNAPSLADKIIESMRKIGGEASGLGTVLKPSKIVDIGFKILDGTIEGFSRWSFGTASIITGLIAIAILVILTLVAINMLLQLCAVWVLAYAGIFFLGFGGSRWTSDMAVNYFKTVLGLGASLMTMTLLVGIGQGIINECLQNMTISPPELGELNVLFVFSITLLLLTDKLPSMVAGIITGASIGQSLGAGAFGAGAAMGAAMTAMAVTKVGMSAAGSAAGALSGLVSRGQNLGMQNLNSMYPDASQSQEQQGQQGQGAPSAMDSMGIKPPGGQKQSGSEQK